MVFTAEQLETAKRLQADFQSSLGMDNKKGSKGKASGRAYEPRVYEQQRVYEPHSSPFDQPTARPHHQVPQFNPTQLVGSKTGRSTISGISNDSAAWLFGSTALAVETPGKNPQAPPAPGAAGSVSPWVAAARGQTKAKPLQPTPDNNLQPTPGKNPQPALNKNLRPTPDKPLQPAPGTARNDTSQLVSGKSSAVSAMNAKSPVPSSDTSPKTNTRMTPDTTIPANNAAKSAVKSTADTLPGLGAKSLRSDDPAVKKDTLSKTSRDTIETMANIGPDTVGNAERSGASANTPARATSPSSLPPKEPNWHPGLDLDKSSSADSFDSTIKQLLVKYAGEKLPKTQEAPGYYPEYDTNGPVTRGNFHLVMRDVLRGFDRGETWAELMAKTALQAALSGTQTVAFTSILFNGEASVCFTEDAKRFKPYDASKLEAPVDTIVPRTATGQIAPDKASHGQDTPHKAAHVQDAPKKATHEQDARDKVTHVQDAPEKATHENGIPGNATHVQSAAVKAAHMQNAPKKATHGEDASETTAHVQGSNGNLTNDGTTAELGNQSQPMMDHRYIRKDVPTVSGLGNSRWVTSATVPDKVGSDRDENAGQAPDATAAPAKLAEKAGGSVGPEEKILAAKSGGGLRNSRWNPQNAEAFKNVGYPEPPKLSGRWWPS